MYNYVIPSFQAREMRIRKVDEVVSLSQLLSLSYIYPRGFLMVSEKERKL